MAPGQTHARPAEVAPMSAAEALVALERARESGRDGDEIIYANRLVAAGGTLSDPARVQAAIDRLGESELKEVWKAIDPRASPAGGVALRLALLRRHAGDPQGAMNWLERVSDYGRHRERALALRQEIEARQRVRPEVVAVLLPLSGRFSAIGREIKAAVSLAAGEERALEVRFFDTAGDPEAAVKAIDRAVLRERAVAILGPVGAAVSKAAAARAAELEVPIGLLSPAEEGAAPEAGVFRLWTSAAWEAREAVRIAVALGYDALAVFAPRDELGAEQRAAFQEAAKAAGVRVVASESYDPTATDLEPDVKRLLNLDPARNSRLRRHLRRHGRKRGWKTYSPSVAFDLLYVPDAHDRAALVASYLPYFNVEVRRSELMDTLSLREKHGGRLPSIVQLLGSSGWHHQSLIPRGGKAVDGALLLDVYSGGSNEEFASDLAARFAARFREAAGRDPGRIAAEAYDAAALFFKARRDGHVSASRDPRAAMTRALRGARLRAGACGPSLLDPRGQLIREAVVLRVDRGEFVIHGY